MATTDVDFACDLMLSFAERTGLSSDRPPLRYLWTDAFAVCNFLGLSSARGDDEFLELALRLVEQTHRVLGRQRPDAEKSGWISGLSEDAGRVHPTQGGLRIGKPLPERGPAEPVDPEAEWDRDGQYFHYLTRWMHALECVSRATGDPTYHRWACELARAACAGFLRRSASGHLRLYWKMSIDLERPQVASTGQHDPLDGLITCCTLAAASSRDRSGPDLGVEIRDLASLCEGRHWHTDDALGVGGLLCDALRLARLGGSAVPGLPGLLEAVLESALYGLEGFVSRQASSGPAGTRLAFRELGLCIGLSAASRLRVAGAAVRLSAKARSLLDEVLRYAPVGARLEGFWLAASNRANTTWSGHRDINEVMLATCLLPDGYLATSDTTRARQPGASP